MALQELQHSTKQDLRQLSRYVLQKTVVARIAAIIYAIIAPVNLDGRSYSKCSLFTFSYYHNIIISTVNVRLIENNYIL
jgi:hypothetical protein